MKRISEQEKKLIVDTIENNTCTGYMTYNGWFVCDECGCQTQGDSYGDIPNYCSNCGRKINNEAN